MHVTVLLGYIKRFLVAKSCTAHYKRLPIMCLEISCYKYASRVPTIIITEELTRRLL